MIKRRNFLQATLATAGAALAGCDSGSDGTGGGGGTTTGTPRKLEDGAKFFPQSVASGDPRPGSVILWTRLADEGATGDLDLSLELSPDAEFSEYIALDGQQSLPLKAEAQFDGCVKVRLGGISPGQVYYYRFIYEKGGKYYTSKIGRTKTAPAENADVAVKFAFVSCQDFIGRYYNTYARMAKEPLDFFVHLGDYVYETTGDPSFQSTDGRKVEFSDKDGAIAITVEKGTYYAAKSLSNYRELYKTYRSDPVLQKVHESFPMIATWDDHEFSDDCHGAVASYFDGKQDETDVDRRKAANQAWFEYMPVDYLGNPEFKYDPSKDFPGDLKIWRDFTFGKHVHLIMTDLRSFRADHLIPEEAFPGTVVVDEAALKAEYGDVPAAAQPYVDIDDSAYSQHKAVLQGAATAGGADPAAVAGNISVAFINAVVSQVNAALVIDEAAQADLPRGIAYIDMGKGSFFSSIGSRYFTIKETFDIAARVAYKKAKKSQDVMGAEQDAWFLSTIKGSTRTWKIWGNEYCVMPLTIDLSIPPVPDSIPPQFKHVFYMN
jgi:alkaline phosphatase D